MTRRAIPERGKRRGDRRGRQPNAPSAPQSPKAGEGRRAEKAAPPASPAPLLPAIPESLGLSPLTAALLTVTAFLDLAEGEVDAAAAGRVLERVGFYAQRLSDDELDELAVDLERLGDYAREQRWPSEQREFIENFLVYCGFELEGEPGDAELEDEEDEGDEDADDPEAGER